YPSIGGYPSNAVWVLDNTSFIANTFRTVANVFADYQITKDLKFRTEFGLDVLAQQEHEFNYRNIQDPLSTSSAWERKTNVFNWTTNNYFSYSKTLNKIHDFDLTLGMAYQRSHTSGVGLTGWDFPNDFFTQPDAAEAVNQSGYSYVTGFAFISDFFRASYKLKDRYLASFSIRSDGSSRFGEENRYGYFPAISGGWIISDEPFLKKAGSETDELKFKPLTFLKLRASYGMTGNANIGDFAYLGVYYPSGGYAGYPGIIPGTLPNPELGWERSTQTDVTLDYSFFDNKIAGTATYYFKKTTDMLLYISLPPSSGYSAIIQNIGQMNNHGWEFSLSTKNLNKAFKWSTDLNIAFNRNKVINAGGLGPDAFESGEPGEGRVLEGFPVGQTYVVLYAGVAKDAQQIGVYDVNGDPVVGADGNQQTITVTPGQDMYYDKFGNLMVAQYYDENGNYRTNADFYEHRVPLGKPIPDFVGGITNNFSYKNFDFSFMFSFVYGNTIYDDPAKNQIGSYDKIAQRPEILEAWTPTNTDTDVPALVWGKNPVNSSRFLYDGSYLRLRSISFGYKLGKATCERIKLSNLRIFVRGGNLWTFTKYPGWDPEVLRNVDPNSQQGNISFAGPSLQTPQARTIMAGIQIEF
ncbi:MAG: SusC/RagA family TonB-linked outer membrane protein, partial [Bacteroidetes bacterium]|nr:SusC/RagA family TonB-linked outer membrane protein [Bacteroidota bacterium]